MSYSMSFIVRATSTDAARAAALQNSACPPDWSEVTAYVRATDEPSFWDKLFSAVTGKPLERQYMVSLTFKLERGEA